jgi:hypothetical protein
MDSILDSLENTSNDYLENKTFESIQKDIYNALAESTVPKYVIKTCCEKLTEYRYVDEIRDVHKGKNVRWLRHGTQKLTTGGIVVDIKFLDNGTHVLVKNNMNRFIQYKFDECLTFQKLSTEEQLILMAYDYLDT